MHTEVVQVLVASTVRSQPSSVPFSIWSLCPGPPGTITTSGAGTSASVRSAVSERLPLSLRTGPGRSATKTVSAPGALLSISYGPTASSAVKRSKSTMAICMEFLPSVCGGRAASQTLGRKRRRYSAGAVPRALRKARRMASGVP